MADPVDGGTAGPDVIPATAAPAPTPDACRRALLRAHPEQPLVTAYDGAGARTELSSASFDNAVAKAANLLVVELGLDAGSVVAVNLPLHWWLPVWCAAASAVGAVLAPAGNAADADLAVCSLEGLERALAAPEVVVCRLDAWGRPFDADVSLPPGVLDAAAASRPHGDHFPSRPVSADPAAPALALPDGLLWRNADVVAEAAQRADDWGMRAGGRLLTTIAPTTASGLLAAWGVPVVAQGSVVLVADANGVDAERTGDSERVTARAR